MSFSSSVPFSRFYVVYEEKLINSITPAPMLLAYHFFSVALYSIYILFTSGVPPMPGQKAHVPSIHEYPYTMYLAFRVVSPPFLFPSFSSSWTEIRVTADGSSGLLVLFSYHLSGLRLGLDLTRV
jgi:hypothetical protein